MMRLLPAVVALVVPEPELCCGWGSSELLGAGAIRFVVEAELQNLGLVEKIALAVSDPQSEHYGQYQTQAQLDALTAPQPEHAARVRAFLAAADAEVTEIKGRRFEVSCSIGEAERLFATTIRTLVNSVTGQAALRAGPYTMPAALEGAVLFGLHGLPLPPKPVDTTAAAQPAKVTPSVIEAQYGVKGVSVSRSPKNRQAVAEFQGQTMSDKDLATFFKDYVPSAKAGDDKVTKFVGDKGDPPAGGAVEASLDIQFIMGVAPGIQTEFWLYNPNDFCADLKNWTTMMLADDAVPWVHSVSYGWQGDLSGIGCSAANSAAVDADLMQLAAKGITIIFASGDSGSGYKGGMFSKAKLWPSWPASSPWVTAVGATRFVDQIAGHEEMASDQFGSGGGFSWSFDRSQAGFQNASVATFFKTEPTTKPFPPASAFNAAGRGTPDVAAIGEGFEVYVNGRLGAVGGTSASAPTFAGLVSLLNEARMQKGKKQLGFLNPFLYQHASSFTDITKGTNAIGRGTGPAKYGYNCVAGWDAATGLGVPKFGSLLAAALQETEIVV